MTSGATSHLMHELSIAMNVVDIAARHAAAAGATRVTAVTLRIGALAAVHDDALRHGFAVARAGTLLDGAELRIATVPIRAWCAGCATEFDLPDVRRLACPACGLPTGDLRAGRELELESLEFEAADGGPEAGP